jgi:putative transposase
MLSKGRHQTATGPDQAKRLIKDWIGFYNSERPHTDLDKRSPDDAFFNAEQNQKAA